MRPETIKRIIEKGTDKERVDLYIEYYAGMHTKSRVTLTDSQKKELFNKIVSSPKARTLYNKQRDIDIIIRNAVNFLSQLRISIVRGTSHLASIKLMSECYINDMKIVINTLFNINKEHLTLEHKEMIRGELLEELSDLPNYYSYKLTDNNMKLDIELGKLQIETINVIKRQITGEMEKAKTFFKALEEYLVEKKVKTKAYYTQFEEIKNDISTCGNFFHLPKYVNIPLPPSAEIYQLPNFEEMKINKLLYEYYKGNNFGK